MDRTHDTDAIRALLARPRRIAVVGASPHADRDSHRVYVYLRDHGHDVIPVNPMADEVAGDATVPDLQAAAERWGAPPEIVDVFRRPEHLAAVVQEAVAVGAPWLWTQFGVVDAGALAAAEAAGLEVVADRCIKVEIARLV